MLYARNAARLLAAAITFCLIVALSIGLTVGLSFAQETDPPPDTTPDTTTPTTPPDTTPPDTTPPDTTPPDTPPTTTTPDSTTTTTTPDSTTTTTTPDSTTTTTTPDAATEWPSIEPNSAVEPGGGTRDRDIYVGTISTLSRAQRAALDEFLAATARLTQAIAARAGIAEATTPDPNAQPVSPYFAPTWPGQETLTTTKHARSTATRIRLRTEHRAPRPPYVDPEKTAEEAAARAAAAQAAVDAAQADLDRATDALRAVAIGDALITALLTG